MKIKRQSRAWRIEREEGIAAEIGRGRATAPPRSAQRQHLVPAGPGERVRRSQPGAPRRGRNLIAKLAARGAELIRALFSNATVMWALTTVVASVAVLSVVPSAAAYDTPARLNDVAHVYSLGVGEVRCDSQGEWDADDASRFAWSYTNLRHDYSVLPPFLCEGALNVGNAAVPLWQQAAGAGLSFTSRFTSAIGASGATKRRFSARPSSTSQRPRCGWARPNKRRTSSTPTRSHSTVNSHSSTPGTATRPASCRPGSCRQGRS